MSEVDLLQYERQWYEQGMELVCGVDEAGRGPLAGPVCAAAVILPKDLDVDAVLPGLNDSKKLTDKKRRELYARIQEVSVAYGIGCASHLEIDSINILQATYLAMNRALAQLTVLPQLALVDGNRDPGFSVPTQLVVKGDSSSASIAAASILAKVYRDDRMLELAQQYPRYGFDVHKGYGTKKHYEALRAYGHCPVHRESFLKKFYGEK